jgi:type I restriction enzyme S subunit
MKTRSKQRPKLLGEVVRFGNGKSIKPGTEGRYAVFGSNGIIGGSDEFRHENGVIIGRVGAYCGAVVYCPDRFWASDNTLVAYPANDQVDTRFLYYLLLEAKLGQHAGGAAQPLVTQTVLKQVEVDVPDLPTQRKIAGILSAYDDLIENNLRRIKILEEMAQSLYREWFVHFRFPGHESTKFVDSPLGPIPKGWEVTSLGDLVEIRKGKNITKTTIREGSIPVVAGGLTPAYYHDTANTVAPVVTISASGANAGFINIYFDDVWASDCSFIDGKVTPDVFYFFLMLLSRQNEVTGLQRGSAQPHVYPKDLMALEALRVLQEIRDDFTQRVTPLFESVRNLHARNQILRRTRDLLLPKLLNIKTP